ncbi:hypothetical protein CVT24_004159 [Panaeolus cyanescens]|uniref:Uncharacterized protein n=1 Tax=Panaeolus cyanescens TaxID=181874 RepID=A0A409Y6J1_9AGAR|nr:hypothetical protein CVT24_004159 [Panaeolus cyanescens]
MKEDIKDLASAESYALYPSILEELTLKVVPEDFYTPDKFRQTSAYKYVLPRLHTLRTFRIHWVIGNTAQWVVWSIGELLKKVTQLPGIGTQEIDIVIVTNSSTRAQLLLSPEQWSLLAKDLSQSITGHLLPLKKLGLKVILQRISESSRSHLRCYSPEKEDVQRMKYEDGLRSAFESAITSGAVQLQIAVETADAENDIFSYEE